MEHPSPHSNTLPPRLLYTHRIVSHCSSISGTTMSCSGKLPSHFLLVCSRYLSLTSTGPTKRPCPLCPVPWGLSHTTPPPTTTSATRPGGTPRELLLPASRSYPHRSRPWPAPPPPMQAVKATQPEQEDRRSPQCPM